MSLWIYSAYYLEILEATHLREGRAWMHSLNTQKGLYLVCKGYFVRYDKPFFII